MAICFCGALLYGALSSNRAWGAAPTLTATIQDAWWSNQIDSDGDGCFEGTARLNWDPNVTGGTGTLTVFEKIYYKKTSDANWSLFRTTNPHTITNAVTSDEQYLDVLLDSGLCLAWDYKIEIYRTNQTEPDYSRNPTNDVDLSNHHEEALCTPKAIIGDVWWSNQTDSNSNRCYEGTARLNWDPHVNCGGGSLTVYEKVFFKLATTNFWMLYGTNPTHIITGISTNDRQYMEIALDGGDCLAWDYKIEIETFRNGHFGTDYTIGPNEKPELHNHHEEGTPCFALGVITDIWWTNRIDSNHDGCFEDDVRLCWDADETCGKGLAVFEKVYYRATGSTNWLLYTNLPSHWIVGADVADQQYLDINLQNATCQPWDFKLELYRLGEVVPDDFRDPSNDPDLSAQNGKATRPALSITNRNNAVLVSWPTNWIGFQVESVTNLDSPLIWQSNSPPAGVVGNRYVVTNLTYGERKFYRLKK